MIAAKVYYESLSSCELYHWRLDGIQNLVLLEPIKDFMELLKRSYKSVPGLSAQLLYIYNIIKQQTVRKMANACLDYYLCLTTKTRQHVAAQCRHDIRPSVQLPSVSRSGPDSKLGITMAYT